MKRNNYEVRCCCNPSLLLGWVSVEGDVKDGQRYAFCDHSKSDDISLTIGVTYLEAAAYRNSEGKVYVAFKSGHKTKIELCQLSRFTFNPRP